jgi:hypothetical protein
VQYFFSRIKKNSDCLFLSITLADLSIGVLCMPNIIIRTTKGLYDLGYYPCIFWIIIDWSSCTISMFSLILLCFHRLRQILKPLKVSENMNKKKHFMIVFLWFITYISWILSVVLIMPQVFNGTDCLMGFSFIYNLLSQIFPFFVPYVLILVLNICTIIALRIKSNKIKFAKATRIVAPVTYINRQNVTNSVNTHSESESSAEQSKPRATFYSFLKGNKENRAYVSISIMSITIFLFWSMFFF